MNVVHMIGNLTRDLETREVGSTTVARGAIALNERWKDKEGAAKESVAYVDFEAWGKTGELMAQHLGKGEPVLIHGKLALDQWEHTDGSKRSRLYVKVTGFEFLPKNVKSDGGSGEGSPAKGRTPDAAPSKEEEIPF